MKFVLKPIALAMLLATGPFAGAAFAITPASTTAPPAVEVKAEKAQLKADEHALLGEEKTLKADEAKTKADRAAGRMAAQSPDAERVYKDQQAIKDEKQVIAADKPGTLKLKADKAALGIEEKLLAGDKASLRADRAEGKMAAQSSDAESVYKDQQAAKGEKSDIVADAAKLKAEQRK